MGEQCKTVGELRGALADLDDDAPLLILYDGQAGVSESIAVVVPREAVEWEEPNTVYLDISTGQG
jgi:hypothetical protein